jgi:hypothetical protein
VRLLELFVEVVKLALELDDLILDHLHTAMVIIIIENVTGYDEIMSSIGAVALLAIPWNQIGILRNY